MSETVWKLPRDQKPNLTYRKGRWECLCPMYGLTVGKSPNEAFQAWWQNKVRAWFSPRVMFGDGTMFKR